MQVRKVEGIDSNASYPADKRSGRNLAIDILNTNKEKKPSQEYF